METAVWNQNWKIEFFCEDMAYLRSKNSTFWLDNGSGTDHLGACMVLNIESLDIMFWGVNGVSSSWYKE